MQDSVQSLSQPAEVSIELFDDENSLGAVHNPPLYYYQSGADKRSLWLHNYQQQLNKEQISTIVESPIFETKTNIYNSMNTNQHPENITLPDEMVNVSGFEHKTSPRYEHPDQNIIGISNPSSNHQINHNINNKHPQHCDQLDASKGADSPLTYFVDLHPQTSLNQDKSCSMEMGSLIRGTEQKMDVSLKINPSKDKDSQHIHVISTSNNNNSSYIMNDQLKNTPSHLNKQTTTWQSQQLIEGRPSGQMFPRSETKKTTISNINNGQWKKKGKNALINMFNIGAVKQVIAHMRQHLILRKIDNLSQCNLKLINDLSYPRKDQGTPQDQILLTRIFALSPLFQVIPVFQPDSLLFIVWSVLVLITILVQVFFIPLEVSFKVGLGSGDFFLGFVYVVEMLVSFNSGYFEEGIVVKDRAKIVLRYLRFQFWMDLATSVSFFMNTNHDIFLLDIIFMIRMASIAILYKEIMQYFQFYRYQAFVDFITLLFWTILMAHYMGCGFHFVSNSGSGTWIELMNLQNSQWQERYVYSIYFSFVTMSTIGYGDIYPVSVSEKIYVIGMLVIGCGWFAYVINAAGQIFSEIQLKKKEIREKQFKILEYMRSRNVSKNLQLKIVKYLDFITTKESNSNSHGEKILESMSKDLREQVLRECYKPILKKHFLFRNYFSEQFLDKLIGHMKEAALGPGEQVFNQNDTEQVLFFIKEGKVDLMLASPTTQESFLISTLQVHKKHNDDQFFGDNQFFQITHQNPYSAVCREQSSLVFLSLDDFIEVGHSFPKDMEQYCHLKDKAFWSRSIHDCEICRQGKHDFLKCPAVFYNPKELLFIYRLNKDTPQFDRIASQRSSYKCPNSLKERQYIQRLTRQFRMTLECIVQGKETEQQIDSNPQSAQKIEEKENKRNSIYVPMDKIIEDADSRTDTQYYQKSGSKSFKKTPQSKNREPIQPKKSLLCRTQISDGDDNHIKNNPRTMKRMLFPRDLIEEGNDKDFFKGCIQLEFLDGEWQQCSEFESDSAEEDTEEEWKEGSINETETHENNQELEGDLGKQQINQQQQQNQQIQQLEQELQQIDEKSQNSPVRFNPLSKNINKKPSPSTEIIPEESHSVLLNENDISPQPQLPEISNRQAPHNISLASLQPSNSSKFTHKGHNNEQMSLSAMPDVEYSPQQNLQKHTQLASEDTGHTVTKGANTNFRRRQRLATRNLGDFMISKAGKKRTYIDSTQQLQSYEFGLGQVADSMQVSGGLGQEAKKILANSSAHQYLNKFARNNNNNVNGKAATNVGMMNTSNLNILQLPMDQSIASPEEQYRRQTSKNRLNLVISTNRQKSFQLHGNSPEEIPIINSNNNNLNIAVGSAIINQLQPQQLQGATAGNTGIVSPLEGGGGGNLIIGFPPRKNALNQIWRAATHIGMNYPGELPETQQFSCVSKLDAMKKYKVYFPAFNHDSVLKNCRRINQNKLKSINQQKKNKKQLPNLKDQGLSGNLHQSQSMFKTIKTNNNHGSMGNNKNDSSFSNISMNFNSNLNGNMSITRSKFKSNTAKMNRSIITAENSNLQIYPKSQLNQIDYQ